VRIKLVGFTRRARRVDRARGNGRVAAAGGLLGEREGTRKRKKPLPRATLLISNNDYTHGANNVSVFKRAKATRRGLFNMGHGANRTQRWRDRNQQRRPQGFPSSKPTSIKNEVNIIINSSFLKFGERRTRFSKVRRSPGNLEIQLP